MSVTCESCPMWARLQYSLCSVSPSPSLLAHSSPHLNFPLLLQSLLWEPDWPLTSARPCFGLWFPWEHLSQLNIIFFIYLFSVSWWNRSALKKVLVTVSSAPITKPSSTDSHILSIKGVNTPTWGMCARSLHPRPPKTPCGVYSDSNVKLLPVFPHSLGCTVPLIGWHSQSVPMVACFGFVSEKNYYPGCAGAIASNRPCGIALPPWNLCERPASDITPVKLMPGDKTHCLKPSCRTEVNAGPEAMLSKHYWQLC